MIAIVKPKSVKIYLHENDKWPIASAYIFESDSIIAIEAVSGYLSQYSSRCENCIKEGSHNLAHGPVDEIIIHAGHKLMNNNVYFYSFNDDDLMRLVKKYFKFAFKIKE